MTYIKWKDEVESYLVSLPQEEKQKIFSYFSEMYADKRDAGKSEEQIIEEFGAPYDVAKKILAESRDAASPQEGGASGVSGGNNYNYNYYNYNYGGAPQSDSQTPRENPPPPPAAKEKPKKSVFGVILGVFLTVVLIIFTISLVGSAVGLAVEGFISIGYTAWAIASAQCGGATGTAMMGYGLIISGVGILLLAPFIALCRFLWRKLRAYTKGV